MDPLLVAVAVDDDDSLSSLNISIIATSPYPSYKHESFQEIEIQYLKNVNVIS